MLSPQEFTKLKTRLTSEPVTPTVSPQEQGGSISRAFGSGVDYAKQGYQESLSSTSNPSFVKGLGQAFEGAGKMIAGGAQALFSPTAPIIEPTLGKGIEKGGEFLGGLYGENIERGLAESGRTTAETVLENVSNLSTTVGLVAGGPKATKIPGKVVQAPLRATGKTLMGAGEGAYGLTVTPQESTLSALQTYQANQPGLFGRVKNMLKGEVTEGKPTTEANTAARYGLAGTEWKLGVQAKQVAQNLWQNQIQPKLAQVKGEVNMKNFLNEVEKEIKKSGGDITRRRSLQEGLQAIKEDYKNVSKINLEKLQEYKEGWAEFLPDATYKGKPIASSIKEVHNLMASKAREIIYKYVGEEGKQAYIDYGNLKSIEKAGLKSVKDPASRGFTKNAWEFIMNKAITPVVTIGGKVLYKTGEGLEFIGNIGATKVKDIIEK